MDSTERKTIHSAKSSILNTLGKSSNQVIGLLQSLDEAESEKVAKVIGLLQPLNEAERKKVIEELQYLDWNIITKLFDGLNREDLKNAVQNMPDLFNKEYLAKEMFNPFSDKEKINQELLDKLKCLPNFDVDSFAKNFLESQKFNGGESLEGYIKNTENNKIKKESFQTIEKRKFDPSSEEDTNLLITKEILKDMINRVEYNYETTPYLKKYIKHRIEEVIDINNLLKDDDE